MSKRYNTKKNGKGGKKDARRRNANQRNADFYALSPEEQEKQKRKNKLAYDNSHKHGD